jgi:hypothetical protein
VQVPSPAHQPADFHLRDGKDIGFIVKKCSLKIQNQENIHRLWTNFF